MLPLQIKNVYLYFTRSRSDILVAEGSCILAPSAGLDLAYDVHMLKFVVIVDHWKSFDLKTGVSSYRNGRNRGATGVNRD